MTLPAGRPPEGYRQPSLEVQQWATKLLSLRGLAQQIGEMLEAQILEHLWRIHQAFERECDFIFFVESELHMGGAAACYQAEVWGAARENRRLREIAQQQPHRAMQLVADLAYTPASEINHAGVAEVLALPARKRATAIHELLLHSSSAGHHPDDMRKIRALEGERDAALAASARQPAEDISLVIEGLMAIEKEIARLGERLLAVREQVTPAARERLLRLTDLASGGLDGLAALAGEDDV